MEILTNEVNIFGTMLLINLPKSHLLGDLTALINKKAQLRITIKENKRKRSLTANAAMWVMCDKIAKALNTTAWEVYLQELERYGVSEWLAVLPDALPAIEKVYRIVKRKGCFTADGVEMVQVQVWRGSSTYDTKEMSVLIDGVIQDAKELGADFISKQDILWEEVKKDECK